MCYSYTTSLILLCHSNTVLCYSNTIVSLFCASHLVLLQMPKHCVLQFAAIVGHSSSKSIVFDGGSCMLATSNELPLSMLNLSLNLKLLTMDCSKPVLYIQRCSKLNENCHCLILHLICSFILIKWHRTWRITIWLCGLSICTIQVPQLSWKWFGQPDSYSLMEW